MNHFPAKVLDNLNTAVLSLDHELKVCFINQSAENLLEVSGKQSIGSKISELILQSKEMEAILYDTLQTGQPYTKRKSCLRLINGNQVTADYTITPLSDDEWPRLLVELHPLDRWLRIERDEGIRTQQATTREMIRGLAHEIKNPLGGIRGAAQLLTEELPDDSLAEYTNIIIEEADRLKELVDRLLGPNRPPQLESTNIHEILERVIILIEAESRGAIEFHRDYDPSIPNIQADTGQLFQAFLNITRNAMQALQETASPQITLVSRTERQFTIGMRQYRLVARVDIIDNGSGITESLKGQLFYPMISGRAGGTGLGLSVAQSIVNLHQGLIEFDSEPGKTVFSVILPLEK